MLDNLYKRLNMLKLCGHYASFFEKLADMFERIGQRLPHYQQHIELFKARGRTFSHQALLNALSHVYADIIMFCQEACKIFSTKKKGTRYKISVIKDLFWKPFDIRFSDLLTRMVKHQELYELELSLADREELVLHYERFDKELEEAETYRKTQVHEIRHRERTELRNRVREIKKWINAPNYMELFEREQLNITQGTGQWLLQDKTYQSWKNSSPAAHEDRSPSPTNTDFGSRVLLIQGSPGYGKTILSIRAIEDMQCNQAQPVEGGESASGHSLAFFHFDKLNTHLNEPHQALRAVLTQIIHQNQSEMILVDTVSLLMDIDGTGQLIGSESETASVLNLALQRFPNTILVFDGIDECLEPSIFLQKLYAICKNAKCKILIFSRPNLQIPRLYQSGIFRLHLTISANLYDIELFLRPQVDNLLASSLLPSYYTAEEIVRKISIRANSLFLWAKLMMNYLECPALSPRDRAEAVDKINLLEGLDALFSKILTAIRTRLLPERQIVFRVFQWLITTYRPLLLSELRAAIAIRLENSSTSEHDYIVNFARSLVLMCGALVEIREDGSVQFIHLSVNEYLTSDEVLSSSFSPGNFHVDVGIAHLALANYSLSYLVWDVPALPLSGSSKATADTAHLRKLFPLLEYALHWWEHAVDGLTAPNKTYVNELFRLTSLLISFLGKKSAITLWIEACWTFSVTIHLWKLADAIGMMKNKTEIPDTGLGALEDLTRNLSNDLAYLAEEWNHVLTNQPNEIWEPSINMFRESQFLVGTDAGNISWMALDNDGKLEDEVSTNTRMEGMTCMEQDSSSMVLASQVSLDGSRLASITLLRPQ